MYRVQRNSHSTKIANYKALAVLLCLIYGGSVPAHTGDRVYPIVEISDEQIGMIDLHDGFVDEWLDVIGPPTLTALNFTELYGAAYQPHDLDFRIWIGLEQEQQLPVCSRSIRRRFVHEQLSSDVV